MKKGLTWGFSTLFTIVIFCNIIIGYSNVEASDNKKNYEMEEVKNLSTLPIVDSESLLFDKEDVSVASNVSEEYLSEALKETKIVDLANVLVEAEKKYNVNSLFLTALVAHESGWGTSERSNNGSNNLTGFAVYKDSSKGTYFESREENVMATAELLSKNYLNENGKHFNGKSVFDVNEKYCIGKDGDADYKWAESITSIAEDLSKKKGVT